MESFSSKRLLKNTLFLYFRMLLLMAVSLYTSRVVLSTLGVEDYGIYNIVGGVIVLFSFLNTAMSGATLRFLSYEIGRNDLVKLKQTFSMSITVHAVISLIILLLAETIGLWFFNNKLNLPEGRLVASQWVYQFSIATFLVSTIRVPYHSLIIAHERMSFYALLSILEGVLKLGVVFLLQVLQGDKLILYGFLLFIVSFCILIAFMLFCRHHWEEGHYKLIWDGPLFKDLISFSGWSVLGSAAVVGSKQGTNILLNIFYGVTLNAAMGIAEQVGSAVHAFVSNFQMAFRPQIIKSYVNGDSTSFFELIIRTAKLSFFLLFLVSLPILLYTEEVLDLWLTVVPAYAVSFTRLIILYSLLESISGPLWMVVQATGKIQKYQVIISGLIISNLWISLIFLIFGFSPTIILIVRIVVNFFILSFRVFYVGKIVHLPIRLFVSKVLLRIVWVIVSSVILSLLIRFYWQTNIHVLILILSSVLIGSFSVLLFGLTKEEKSNLWSVFIKYLYRIAQKVSND